MFKATTMVHTLSFLKFGFVCQHSSELMGDLTFSCLRLLYHEWIKYYEHFNGLFAHFLKLLHYKISCHKIWAL